MNGYSATNLEESHHFWRLRQMAFHFRPPILFCILQTFNLESTIDSDNVSETATVQSVKLHATVRMHKTPKFVNYII